ncbi:MAG: alpha/beta fold hydrolase [Patescibacteria group bacterium]|nr:alpha/beta fold hydrolase [Patescibacteria group bacterium]
MKPKYLLVLIVLLIVILSGVAIYYYFATPEKSNLPFLGEKTYNLAFVTEDDMKIAATYYPSLGTVSDRGVVLVHSAGTDRREWVDLAQKLQNNGYEVITMDLRGHGLSEGNLKKFTEADYQKMEFDLREAFEYLGDLKEDMRIAVIGSSLGANVGLKTAAQDDRVQALILLSPAKDYLGVKVSKKIQRYKNDLLIIFSQKDELSANDSKELFEKSKSENKEEWEIEKNAHGAEMFEKEEGLEDRMMEWLNNNL